MEIDLSNNEIDRPVDEISPYQEEIIETNYQTAHKRHYKDPSEFKMRLTVISLYTCSYQTDRFDEYIGFVVRQAFIHYCGLHQVWREPKN